MGGLVSHNESQHIKPGAMIRCEFHGRVIQRAVKPVEADQGIGTSQSDQPPGDHVARVMKPAIESRKTYHYHRPEQHEVPAAPRSEPDTEHQRECQSGRIARERAAIIGIGAGRQHEIERGFHRRTWPVRSEVLEVARQQNGRKRSQETIEDSLALPVSRILGKPDPDGHADNRHRLESVHLQDIDHEAIEHREFPGETVEKLDDCDIDVIHEASVDCPSCRALASGFNHSPSHGDMAEFFAVRGAVSAVEGEQCF